MSVLCGWVIWVGLVSWCNSYRHRNTCFDSNSVGYISFFYLWIHISNCQPCQYFKSILELHFFFRWQAYYRSTKRATVFSPSSFSFIRYALIDLEFVKPHRIKSIGTDEFSLKSRRRYFYFLLSDHHIYYFLNREKTKCRSDNNNEIRKSGELKSIIAWNGENANSLNLKDQKRLEEIKAD